MMAFSNLKDRVTAFVGRKEFTYSALPENGSKGEVQRRATVWTDRHKSTIRFTGAVMILAIIGVFVVSLTCV
jgi:hypothetical protein